MRTVLLSIEEMEDRMSIHKVMEVNEEFTGEQQSVSTFWAVAAGFKMA
jgi:hypothetical protein